MMLGIDGFEVTKQLRANEKTRLMPIVLITALKESEDRIKGIEAGCDDFISKPFNKDEVLAKIKTLLKLSFYRSQLDEKRKLETVIQNMSDGIVICDADWTIKETNASARTYLGIANTAGRDKFLDIVFNNFSVSITKKGLINPSELHKSFDIVREETESAKPLYLKTSLDILKGPAGEVSSIVLTLRDVTEERRGEIMKQDFLSLISHKLRTPTNVIYQAALMLLEGILGVVNEKQGKMIGSIVEKSHEITRLIEKLFTFVTVHSQKLDLAKEKIELRSYLCSFADSLDKAKKDKKVEINIDCQDKNLTVSINRSHLDLIIRNLTENAIKFNDKEVVKIDIVARESQGGVKISVIDNGPDILLEEQEKIFEKFYQIEKSFTGNVDGVGLGLTLVRRLVFEYGGEIQVQSEVGKGSRFILTFCGKE